MKKNKKSKDLHVGLNKHFTHGVKSQNFVGMLYWTLRHWFVLGLCAAHIPVSELNGSCGLIMFHKS